MDIKYSTGGVVYVSPFIIPLGWVKFDFGGRSGIINVNK